LYTGMHTLTLEFRELGIDFKENKKF
jgi:hypothetical protein